MKKVPFFTLSQRSLAFAFAQHEVPPPPRRERFQQHWPSTSLSSYSPPRRGSSRRLYGDRWVSFSPTIFTILTTPPMCKGGANARIRATTTLVSFAPLFHA